MIIFRVLFRFLFLFLDLFISISFFLFHSHVRILFYFIFIFIFIDGDERRRQNRVQRLLARARLREANRLWGQHQSLFARIEKTKLNSQISVTALHRSTTQRHLKARDDATNTRTRRL